MTTLIIDCSLLIIERLKELLNGVTEIKTISQANSYEHAQKMFRKEAADIVLLDLCLPENASLKLLREMREANSNTRVIILTDNPDVIDESRYLLAGASCVLDKYHEFEKIPDIIRKGITLHRQHHP